MTSSDQLSANMCIDRQPHRIVWVPIPADTIQTDSHCRLRGVTSIHVVLQPSFGRFLLRLGPHKQLRGPFSA
jgi:hypothetical protein